MSRNALDAYAYAREVLLPALALQNHPFRIRRPTRGGTSASAAKFVVVIERAPALLVRVYDGWARARRGAVALRHLERLDLPAPRLKLADISPVNPLFRRNGLPRWATAETWIEGTRAFEWSDPEWVALRVAEVLARWHAASRSRWGRPGGLPDLRPYPAVTMSLALGMIRDLEQKGVLSPAEAAEGRGRFEGWRKSLMKIGTFHLVHSDANRRNFIVTSDKEKRVIPIDVQRASYEPCAEEVANALYHFCRKDERLAASFLHTYLEAATPSCRTTWERGGDFFRSLNMLKRLHRKAVRGTEPADEEAPPEGAAPAADPRLPAWKEAVLCLPPPPRVWPEPGSPPPA